MTSVPAALGIALTAACRRLPWGLSLQGTPPWPQQRPVSLQIRNNRWVVAMAAELLQGD
ncbi:MAG: hypothetical protein ACKOCM_01375 [Cyanobacteriota bacterium]